MNIIKFFKILIVPLLIFIILPGTSFSQSKEDLIRKKKEAQKEIKLANKLLNKTRKGKKESYNDLMILKKQISSRKNLIDNIQVEIKALEDHISKNTAIIESLEKDLNKLKDKYARMIKYAYKTKNSTNRLLFIMASDDFNQAYKRLSYLKEVAKFRRKQAEAIKSMQRSIELQNEKLQEKKEEKRELLAELGVEKEKLYQEKKQQNQMLNKLKSRESELEKKIKKERKRAKKLQNEIERLIAAEAESNAGSSYELTPEEKLISANFGNNKGRLPWPVESGIITSKFGTHKHPVIKNIEINNNGVDIATAKESSVRSLFNGEVRKIFSVPGYQNAVIIRHGNYLTTYTHLDKVFVEVGEKVKTKQRIGVAHTNKNEGKTVVHVEIWYGQKKLDPEQWLAD